LDLRLKASGDDGKLSRRISTPRVWREVLLHMRRDMRKRLRLVGIDLMIGLRRDLVLGISLQDPATLAKGNFRRDPLFIVMMLKIF
jgi:hypothetical protein